MAGAGAPESGESATKRAKSGDGPSISSSRPWWKERMADDGAAGSGGDDDFEVAVEEGSQDPLAVFGSGIMLVILSRLDARSVALARLVSRGWLAVASVDEIWAPKDIIHILRDWHLYMVVQSKNIRSASVSPINGEQQEAGSNCEELWQGKAHIPRIAKVPGLTKMAVFSLSMMDSKRARITRDDLCDHVWEFHFTEDAPEYWRNLDPRWNGTGATMRRYFQSDGSITADPEDKVWGGHESSYTVVTGLYFGGKMREHYVRINRWPQMSVQRRADWGWVLSNHLYCYTSVPDPDKPDGTGPSL
ncbi:hypothetical protein ABFX02_07G057200 [Erythranthe guttata]